jgi:hypothetical protein
MNVSALVITILQLDEAEDYRPRKLSCLFKILMCLSCEQFVKPLLF